jgi:hypothetical protein
LTEGASPWEGSGVPQDRVRELADALARELESSGEALDEETRTALARLEEDVAAALDGEPLEAPPSVQARTLLERLERDHPDLTALVQRLTDALMSTGL